MVRYVVRSSQNKYKQPNYTVWDTQLGCKIGLFTFTCLNTAENYASMKNAEHNYHQPSCCGLSFCDHFQIKHKRHKKPYENYYEVNILHPITGEWLVFINSPSLAQKQLNILHNVFINGV